MTHIQGLAAEGLAADSAITEGLKNTLQETSSPSALASESPDDDISDKPTAIATPRPLGQHVRRMLEDYFRDLDGHAPTDLYQMVLSEVEQPLLEAVLRHTRGNQSKAATLLGLNRGTLRKKLKQYDIN